MSINRNSKRFTDMVTTMALSVLLAAVFLSACTAGSQTSGGISPSQEGMPSPESPAPAEATAAAAGVSMDISPVGGIVYQNTEYGFDFNLPKDWDGYTVIPEKWEGRSITGEPKIVETGPIILIRNPKWTGDEPMQDIPIMVFTIDQWNALQREEFTVSAAPIGPSELGRNLKYVFALPPRYNFSYLSGYEDVEDIMNSNPLRAYDISK